MDQQRARARKPLELGGKRSVDWDLFAALGAPLLVTNARAIRADPEALSDSIHAAAAELSENADGVENSRRLEAFQAVLLALRSHFPTYYRQRLSRNRRLASFLPRSPSGRVIKLARLALGKLATYL